LSKPLVWVAGEVKTPPFSFEGRQQAGLLLRALQDGHKIGLPSSRPMPSIGRRVHELRINDKDATWRIIYRIDVDAIVVFDVFAKKTQKTSAQAIKRNKARIKHYDSI